MSREMNRDLFLAILAMDSYNRDYGAGVKIEGVSIGKANLISRDSLNLGLQCQFTKCTK